MISSAQQLPSVAIAACCSSTWPMFFEELVYLPVLFQRDRTVAIKLDFVLPIVIRLEATQQICTPWEDQTRLSRHFLHHQNVADLLLLSPMKPAAGSSAIQEERGKNRLQETIYESAASL
jgi:hypothetical protein